MLTIVSKEGTAEVVRVVKTGERKHEFTLLSLYLLVKGLEPALSLPLEAGQNPQSNHLRMMNHYSLMVRETDVHSLVIKIRC